MTVHQLGRIADGIGGNRMLAFEIEFSGGFGREYYLKIKPGKKFEPKRQIFIHI